MPRGAVSLALLLLLLLLAGPASRAPWVEGANLPQPQPRTSLALSPITIASQRRPTRGQLCACTDNRGRPTLLTRANVEAAFSAHMKPAFFGGHDFADAPGPLAAMTAAHGCEGMPGHSATRYNYAATGIADASNVRMLFQGTQFCGCIQHPPGDYGLSNFIHCDPEPWTCGNNRECVKGAVCDPDRRICVPEGSIPCSGLQELGNVCAIPSPIKRARKSPRPFDPAQEADQVVVSWPKEPPRLALVPGGREQLAAPIPWDARKTTLLSMDENQENPGAPATMEWVQYGLVLGQLRVLGSDGRLDVLPGDVGLAFRDQRIYALRLHAQHHSAPVLQAYWQEHVPAGTYLKLGPKKRFLPFLPALGGFGSLLLPLTERPYRVHVSQVPGPWQEQPLSRSVDQLDLALARASLVSPGKRVREGLDRSEQTPGKTLKSPLRLSPEVAAAAATAAGAGGAGGERVAPSSRAVRSLLFHSDPTATAASDTRSFFAPLPADAKQNWTPRGE
jgi:hypothetical protein